MSYILHPYQKAVVRHICKNRGTGVFLGMGLGKTLSTLEAVMVEMFDKLAINKTLIVAPKKVAEATWQKEAKKWGFPLRISTVLGSAKERILALNRPADVYIINRENVVWLCEHYGYQLPFDMLVLDESTSFKSNKAKRWKSLKRVCLWFKKIVLLTGTPSPNGLMDLWAQVYLLDGGKRLGRTLTEFRNNYFIPDKRNGHIVFSYKIRSKEAEREIYRLISDICVSLKSEDYRTMPDMLPPVFVPIKIDDKSMKHYRELENEYITELANSEITALSAAAVSNKLLQLANGAVYTEDKKVIEVHSAKIEALKEIVEAAGSPVLVFYNFVHDLDRLQKAFPDSRVLKTPKDEDDWNAGRIPILLAHPASAGYGLNIQAGGHTIVWFGLTWSLEQYQQANARLYRQGQTKPVIIHHLVAEHTIDERIVKALQTKATGQNVMLEAVKLMIKEKLNENFIKE